jgi:hypothetical protein
MVQNIFLAKISDAPDHFRLIDHRWDLGGDLQSSQILTYCEQAFGLTDICLDYSKIK